MSSKFTVIVEKDEARAYANLQAHLKLTQQAVADRVGKDRATVANALRLLQLPTSIQGMVAAGQLSAGHARALLSMDSPEEMLEAAKQIVEQSLSVRDIEEVVRARKPRHKGHRAKRRVILIPDSGHGTNPATAAMAGYEVVEMPSQPDGTISTA